MRIAVLQVLQAQLHQELLKVGLKNSWRLKQLTLVREDTSLINWSRKTPCHSSYSLWVSPSKEHTLQYIFATSKVTIFRPRFFLSGKSCFLNAMICFNRCAIWYVYVWFKPNRLPPVTRILFLENCFAGAWLEHNDRKSSCRKCYFWYNLHNDLVYSTSN